ncbi:MAG: class II glutamine amidotransferase [Deltaproteobacteria bacterium]|nr:class II glutamine amidotransferase [Deltaproteobacteria bacterium]
MAMSFDSGASPSVSLRALAQTDLRSHAYGWGFAWYPDQSNAALLVKDATSLGENAMTKLLREWDRFHSTLFVCHLRGAARALQEQDTHPFKRVLGRREWVLAHNGDLEAPDGDLGAVLSLGEDPAFEPMGRTDSEHAFCWLLQNVRGLGARSLAEVGWETLHGWFKTLDNLGTANFLLTDGRDLAVYSDETRYNVLHWARLVPPNVPPKLVTDDLEVDLDDARDRARTLVIFSTLPLSDGGDWRPMNPGQLVVVRQGAFVFDSDAEQQLMVPPLQTTPEHPKPDRVPASRTPSVSLERFDSPAMPVSAVAVSPETSGTLQGLGCEHHYAQVDGIGRLLSIVHETLYSYARPVEKSFHLYRLKPVHDRWQDLLDFTLEISVEGVRRPYEDVFGNAVLRADVERPYQALSVIARSLVRVRHQPPDDLHSPHRRFSIPLVWMPWQRQMMSPYLLPPELPETELVELTEFAMSFVERQDYDLVQTLIDMNTTIYRDFKYLSGSTTIATTPFQVFRRRTGVCQDFANLFICLARLLGVPARYRVGYIFTGADYENRMQSEASHAWAELYLPWNGWQGFDPTNGCLVGTDHVRVAAGRNYMDATPTSGTIYKGGGAERLSVKVRVEEVAEGGQREAVREQSAPSFANPAATDPSPIGSLEPQ